MKGHPYGISKVNSHHELKQALLHAFNYDYKVLIEEFIQGFEVGCAVLAQGDQLIVGCVDEIETNHDFFDFDGKYHLSGSTIHLPARIPLIMEKSVQDLAKRIFRLMDCSGLARIDFFISQDHQILFKEINTIPGMTLTSRYPNMMNRIQIEFTELIKLLIRDKLKGSY